MSKTTAKIVSTSAPGRKMKMKPSKIDPDIIPARRRGRIGAFFLDGLLLPLLLVLNIIPGIGFLLTLLYMSFKGNSMGAGRSLGRAAVGQRLMRVDGEEATHGQVVARNAVRILFWMTFFPFFFDLFSVVFGDGRLLADRVVGTKVFEDPEKVRASRMIESEEIAARVVEEGSIWDERFDQEELESIVGELRHGEEGMAEADLEEFERRLREDGAPGQVADPVLREMSQGVEEVVPAVVEVVVK